MEQPLVKLSVIVAVATSVLVVVDVGFAPAGLLLTYLRLAVENDGGRRGRRNPGWRTACERIHGLCWGGRPAASQGGVGHGRSRGRRT